MYKRKFPKTKNAVEKPTSQLSMTLQSSSDIGPSSVLKTSTPDDDGSPVSPSLLDDFGDFSSVVKKRKTTNTLTDDDSTTDAGSQPLFDDNDDEHSFLKQTLISCGLRLERDQNTICKCLQNKVLEHNAFSVHFGQCNMSFCFVYF